MMTATNNTTATHQQLATAWALYNSRTGRVTEKQVAQMMKTPEGTLRILLAKRGIAA